ncbi:CST complex subunit TEN1 isoform X2 [Amblyraja radiata]|uniref:CST complex subunit TEN1 isoform X2 n=1 Tax=Amblyraja radiata TaxID=386614 RepID=UPI001403209D|nr:CST complex subunit TEN1 isoform X2 [Amblyraja radiata]
MLPKPGEFHFLWEICSGAVDEGSTVRTFGRLQILTSLVEPFEARIGTEYMALGEMESTTGNVPVIQARLLIDADGVDLPLLEHAVQEQRKYFQQRDRSALETKRTGRRDV